jgi:catechol 2,3-dioxygenase-like lactoylglutathione lyase family enzyme
MSEKNLLQVTPWLLSNDVAAMTHFFVEVLGFHAWAQDEYYAYVSRDDAAVRIGKLSEPGEESAEWGPRAWLFYVDVRDVDALVSEFRPKLLTAALAAGEGPKNQPWGKREFWAPVPGGGFIIFGQESPKMPAANLAAQD